MCKLAIFTVSLLVASAATAPTSSETVVVDENFFNEDIAVYTAEHGIYNLVVPLNALNFEDDSDDETDDDLNSVLFFVQADVDDAGNKDYKGLYVLKNKVATKLLDNGRDAAAVNDDTKLVYFAADDGLYVYNNEKNTAEKYGTLNDNFIAIAKQKGDILYVVNDKFELFKVTDEGKKKKKIKEVKSAQQIVLDDANNIYYVDENKVSYVFNGERVRKVSDLPENPKYIQLLKPPFIFTESIPIVVDNESYIIYANGTSEKTDFEFKVRPTGYAMEATLIQYYSFNKVIYEYNILALILDDMLTEVKGYLEDKKEAIASIATRSRSDLKA